MPDQPVEPTNSTELPPSVLEPLHTKSDSPSTNPFGEYDAHETSQQATQGGGASTAFALVSDRTSDRRHLRNATVLYPEGLPKFLGLLRPTMTFGIGYSTLSRGMDFTAHFVAISTVVFFSGILIAISWMQKVCLPIVRHWNYNYTLGFGAFAAVLAIFSWRSAANFDLRRSKVFLFLLGWRLHSFMFLSLLMALGLVLRPQLYMHVENSVRACVLERHTGEVSAFFPFGSSVPVSPNPSHSEVQEGDNLFGISEREGGVGTAVSTAQAKNPATTASETRQGRAAGSFVSVEGSVNSRVEISPISLVSSALPKRGTETPAVGVQLRSVGNMDGLADSPVAGEVNISNDGKADASTLRVNRDATDSAVSANGEPQSARTADSSTRDAGPTLAASTALPGGALRISHPLEDSSETDAGGKNPESETRVDEAAEAVTQQDQETGEAVDPSQLFEGQQLTLEAAQRSALQELNTIIVVVLIVASVALVFELYLVYACWSFKVWMERGYESVVLSGTPPFATVDAGNGWLAYAVRMPQTVQMETYGSDARGSGRLPLFVQTTDTSDFTAHLGLPITGRW